MRKCPKAQQSSSKPPSFDLRCEGAKGGECSMKRIKKDERELDVETWGHSALTASGYGRQHQGLMRADETV